MTAKKTEVTPESPVKASRKTAAKTKRPATPKGGSVTELPGGTFKVDN